VLYVDDEEQSLKYFRKACEKDFRVLTAPNADEAIATIKNKGDEIGILITDQRMPGKSGVDVLSSIRRTHPAVIRILTTAYSDLDSAIAAVNSGAIYKYVHKPWDLQELRGVLMRAMEFFLVQRERDALLREKLSVLQRIIITDRVKSLAALAAGLAHHVRNSMVALRAFLDIVGKEGAAASAEAGIGSMPSGDMWSLAERESKRILGMVQSVADATVRPSYSFDAEISLDRALGDVTRSIAETASRRSVAIEAEVAEGLPLLRSEKGMLERLFATLLDRAVSMSPDGGKVRLAGGNGISVWGAPGVKVTMVLNGSEWTHEQVSGLFTAFVPDDDAPRALGLDLLSAFFMCHHHGGDIVVHRAPPKGPGFEVFLPFDPDMVERPTMQEDFMEKLFSGFEESDIDALA
jgi:two-component system probable response regulator PhcQ